MTFDLQSEVILAYPALGTGSHRLQVTALIGMLRSLGVRISEKQLLELTNKAGGC